MKTIYCVIYELLYVIRNKNESFHSIKRHFTFRIDPINSLLFRKWYSNLWSRPFQSSTINLFQFKLKKHLLSYYLNYSANTTGMGLLLFSPRNWYLSYENRGGGAHREYLTTWYEYRQRIESERMTSQMHKML